MSEPMITELSDYAEKLIRGRHATRAFRPEPVPEDTLRAIFSLAGAAPSNSNAQPWRIEVASGAKRDRLARALQAAHAERHLSVDFPYSEDMYTTLHQDRRAAFGAELYGALGIGFEDHAARAAYDAESRASTGRRTPRSCSSPVTAVRGWPPMSAPTCRRCCWP
ncbi:nitroreductase family protein [Streptomyces albus]